MSNHLVADGASSLKTFHQQRWLDGASIDNTTNSFVPLGPKSSYNSSNAPEDEKFQQGPHQVSKNLSLSVKTVFFQNLNKNTIHETDYLSL